MKTIAIYHPSAELYGADRIMVEAIKAFPSEYEKTVYLPKYGPLTSYICENSPETNIQIVSYMPVISRALFTPRGIIKFIWNWLKFARFVRRENKREGFDLAYVNTLACVFLLPIMGINKIRRFIHVHEIIDKPKVIGWATAWVSLIFAQKVVCVSAAVEKGLVRYSKGITKKTIVIHNGIHKIDVDFKDNKTLDFYLFGRIKPEKGQWFLISALSKMDKLDLENCRFTLMGGSAPGQENRLEELQRTIDDNGLTEFVRIKGFASQIESAMEEADVCLVPSQMKDPFPTTVLEAMSAGRPVIATDHGGASEAIEHNKSGFLVNPESTKELAAAILSFINNKKLIASMGDLAKNRFLANYTHEHFKINWSSFINCYFS